MLGLVQRECSIKTNPCRGCCSTEQDLLGGFWYRRSLLAWCGSGVAYLVEMAVLLDSD